MTTGFILKNTLRMDLRHHHPLGAAINCAEMAVEACTPQQRWASRRHHHRLPPLQGVTRGLRRPAGLTHPGAQPLRRVRPHPGVLAARALRLHLLCRPASVYVQNSAGLITQIPRVDETCCHHSCLCISVLGQSRKRTKSTRDVGRERGRRGVARAGAEKGNVKDNVGALACSSCC